MLSKEECEKALLILKQEYDSNPYVIVLFEDLIKEHFELVEKYNRIYDECPQKCEMLKQLQDEVDKYKHEYFAMCDLFENPQPYKFEDLKVGMWVYSKEYERCFRIKKLRIYEYDTGGFYKGQKLLRVQTCKDGIWDDIPFEENRFFPVQMANVR